MGKKELYTLLLGIAAVTTAYFAGIFFDFIHRPSLTERIFVSISNPATLNLWDSGPLTLDPAISSEMSSHLYVMQIFSGLVKFDSELKPVPDLAERWEISADGKTYTFYLREVAKFQDGRKISAADF